MSIRSSLVAKGVNPQTVVLDRLKELGKSRYWLAQAVKGQVSEPTLYRWLRGEMPMLDDNLPPVFKALGLVVKNEHPDKS
jgi:hypothetical protein